ncbi:hypothetical protein [Bifidobacterium vansinderenii]|uniref:Uncharacterized protein n=1 Tax=Bifidobacterium vansinderenii TaxID=1984871 RepID=A0A229VYZ5_9BIFI|nr:hypothetical protein [Bifidobacterium vansinderenii]OXN00849.1 hypothetical protein Tam10B_0805 [Bifidobacterium vansinderenii]
MSDSKALYSSNAKRYIEDTVPSNLVDQGRYERSKAREARWNDNWKRQPVNLNEVVKQFAPGDIGHGHGVKYVFTSDRYEIRVDQVAGYPRIFDKRLKRYVKLDGKAGTNQETHFKILTRKEMDAQ